MDSIDLGPAPELPIRQIVLMVISYISMFLYIWIIVVIIKYRRKYPPLQSPFYQLLINQAFADFTMFLIIELVLRPRKYRFLPLSIYNIELDQFFPKFSYFCMVSARSIMFLGYIPFAANRFTIFFRPTIYQRIWTNRTTFICALVQWSVPLSINAYAFFLTDCRVFFQLLPNGVLQMSTDQYLGYADNLQGILVGSLVTIACGTMYMWSFKRAKRHTLPPEVARSEVRLLIGSAVTFIPLILDSFRNIALLVFEHLFGSMEVFAISAELVYFSTEIASVTQPWAILLTNETIRNLLRGRTRMNEMKTLNADSKTSKIFMSPRHPTTKEAYVSKS